MKSLNRKNEVTAPMCFDNDNVDDATLRGHRRMWQAVITQAFYDARAARCNATPQWVIDSAKKFLFTPNKDFVLVCEYAGYDHRYILRKIKEAIERGTIFEF